MAQTVSSMRRAPPATARRRRAAHLRGSAACWRRAATAARLRWPVSISTVDAHAGAQQSRSPRSLSKAMRTGTRCTTLTQLPLAFCGGRIANCAPVPGLTDVDGAVEGAVGEGVDVRSSTFWPTLQIGDVGFLRIGVDPGRAVVDHAEHRRAGGDEAAELDVVDLRRDAVDRRAQHGVVEIALRLVERGLRPADRPGISRSAGRDRRAAG